MSHKDFVAAQVQSQVWGQGGGDARAKRPATGFALPWALNGVLIYMALDQFILRFYGFMSMMSFGLVANKRYNVGPVVDPFFGAAVSLTTPPSTEGMVDWMLEASLMLPGQMPFTATFIVLSLFMLIATKNRPIVRERFHQRTLLVTAILFFFFAWHVVSNYLAILLPHMGE
jgi:hypothetical protein